MNGTRAKHLRKQASLSIRINNTKEVALHPHRVCKPMWSQQPEDWDQEDKGDFVPKFIGFSNRLSAVGKNTSEPVAIHRFVYRALKSFYKKARINGTYAFG